MFPGTLAIGITANFINHRTRQEAAVQEIGGLFKIFKPELFQLIQDKTGMELETVVYFKNETHYFVMSLKRQSLLRKGVIQQVKGCGGSERGVSEDSVEKKREQTDTYYKAPERTSLSVVGLHIIKPQRPTSRVVVGLLPKVECRWRPRNFW